MSNSNDVGAHSNLPDSSKSLENIHIAGGTYEILAPIGRGRGATIYRAKKHNPLAQENQLSAFPNESIVALKTLNPGASQDALRRFRHEAIAMLSCQGKNITRIFDYITSTEQPFLVMEYAELGDLANYKLRRRATLSSTEVIQMIIQVLSGVEEMHNAGILHRDIKPENILVFSDRSIKIGDFGTSLLPRDDISFDDLTSGIGTFDYLAPECLNGTGVCEASDVFSVGVTLFQLLTGSLPFKGETVIELIDAKLSGQIAALEDFISEPMEGLSDILRKALSRDPSNRFHRAADFRKALAQLSSGKSEDKEGQQVPASGTRDMRHLITRPTAH
ncbi:MAG: serine/threonine-protein kinase [bacterium]|nr:serine/threonine-protein kinase [bacterium]